MSCEIFWISGTVCLCIVSRCAHGAICPWLACASTDSLTLDYISFFGVSALVRSWCYALRLTSVKPPRSNLRHLADKQACRSPSGKCEPSSAAAPQSKAQGDKSRSPIKRGNRKGCLFLLVEHLQRKLNRYN